MKQQGSSALGAALEKHKEVSVDTRCYMRECEQRKQAYCNAWLGDSIGFHGIDGALVGALLIPWVAHEDGLGTDVR